MRRGHAGFSGWRTENPRLHRPRNGGNNYYRMPSGYGPIDTRHPPLGKKHKNTSYNPRFDNNERSNGNQSETFRYQTNHNTYNIQHERPHGQHSRKNFPVFQRNKPYNPTNVYNDNYKFYENNFDNRYCEKKKSMEVVDHQQHMPLTQMPLWANESKTFIHRTGKKQINDLNVLNNPLPEYSGHRPPSSDHYGCNPTISTVDKSNSFSRSVDDTVDIVRKRLLNRNDSTPLEDFSDKNISDEKYAETYLNVDEQEQPTKRRIQRPDKMPVDQANCAKIKNKIVNQLFKMDKERIHKLMNNPNSSTKFEYAISSLITESQNSYNRHLRSVAEKSLCNSSNEFIANDDNTIYEDTFMKQMQCILDPQDTVLLEDIKPIVMAELINILQIDNVDSPFKESNANEDNNYNHFSNENYNFDHCSEQMNADYCEPQTSQVNYSNTFNINQDNYDNHKQDQRKTGFYPLFERRPSVNKQNVVEANYPSSSKSQFYNMRKDLKETEDVNSITELKLFERDLEHFSEEDDTFAELDNQYHVAIDHDFIDEDDISVPHVSNTDQDTNNIQIQNISVPDIKSDISFQNISHEQEKYQQSEKVNISANSSKHKKQDDANNMYQETKSSNEEHHAIKTAHSKPNSRKRLSDQRPSHRKEKRKKSDSNQVESNKQILNKNIIINVNDCAKKTSENFDSAPKSIFNLFFSKNKDNAISKDSKSVCESSCTEKHAKKKQIKKKHNKKSKKSRQKHSYTSSNQSSSPKEMSSNINKNQLSNIDNKSTLTTIDMFTEKPRKLNIHQAHRNTALTPKKNDNTNNENKPSTKIELYNVDNKTNNTVVNTIKKMHSKESQTFESKVFTSRFCQTERKKFAVKAIQTDDEPPNKPCMKAMDAFERMKEIDLEIQILLQEKFKLYGSMESSESYGNTLQTLGMTVLNVSPCEDGSNEIHEITLSEDIVGEFTTIPIEELEGIAIETIIPEPDSESNVIDEQSGYDNQDYGNIKSPLENITTLDVFDKTPVKKTLNRKRKKKMPCKKGVTKKKSKEDVFTKYNLKECSVVLTVEDLNQYFSENKNYTEIESHVNIVLSSENTVQHTSEMEETVCNDMFDMLDVSEDIVIGDVYEEKSVYDKEVVEQVMSVSVNEEVILDNSQSSIDDLCPPTMGHGNECKVYDYSADENLQRDSILVSGNADAVLAIECVENNFLAASLDGSVYHFSGDGQLLSTLRGSNLAVTCLTIVKEKYGTTVYTGSLDSRIRYYDLETGLEKGPECNVLSPIQTMDRAWDTIFVGTRTGFVLQFECKNNMLIPVSTVKFSEQSILALKAMKEGPRKVLLVAARSENVTVKDAQSGLLLRTLEGPKMTVYSLLYEDGKVYTGTSSHQIHVFDYASGAHVGTHSGGKGAVCLRSTGGLILAGCYDGCVYVYREGEQTPRAQLRGPSLMLLSLAIVGTKIIAGYKDRSLYIWKIPLSILEDMIL